MEDTNVETPVEVVAETVEEVAVETVPEEVAVETVPEEGTADEVVA